MTASITMEIVVIYVYSDLRGLNVNVQMVWSCLLIKRVAYVSAFQFIHRRAVMKFLVTWYLSSSHLEETCCLLGELYSTTGNFFVTSVA